MQQGRPIPPSEVRAQVRNRVVASIPPEVIDEINRMIVEFWQNNCAFITVKTMTSRFTAINNGILFPSFWWNFPSVFQTDWEVTRVDPDAFENENFDAYYKFSNKN